MSQFSSLTFSHLWLFVLRLRQRLSQQQCEVQHLQPQFQLQVLLHVFRLQNHGEHDLTPSHVASSHPAWKCPRYFAVDWDQLRVFGRCLQIPAGARWLHARLHGPEGNLQLHFVFECIMKLLDELSFPNWQMEVNVWKSLRVSSQCLHLNKKQFSHYLFKHYLVHTIWETPSKHSLSVLKIYFSVFQKEVLVPQFLQYEHFLAHTNRNLRAKTEISNFYWRCLSCSSR